MDSILDWLCEYWVVLWVLVTVPLLIAAFATSDEFKRWWRS